MVNPGFDGWLLGVLSAGISTPCGSFMRALTEILLAGILRLVGLIYLATWNRTCKKVFEKT